MLRDSQCQVRLGLRAICNITLVCLSLAACAPSPLKATAITERAHIAAGQFAPLYGLDTGQSALPVGEFWIDRLPVTNNQFKNFVDQHKEWDPTQVNVLLSDEGYLSHWPDKGARRIPLEADLQAPVVHVSWFAAQAYCEFVGGRLPSVLEWEYVAAASETKQDASRDPEFVARILAWYSNPQGVHLSSVGQTPANYWGVSDLHGLIWEWTSDFNSIFVAGDNRREDDRLKNLFCGDAATGAARREDYAAFMRYALRNSLQARFTLGNLGFRCAYDDSNRS